MRNRKHTRGLSLLLCAALLAGQLGTTVYAEGSSTGNREVVCEHHPEHTEACGYMEAEPGQPCQHQHTGDCYTDELICGFDDEDAPTATDSDATTVHEHTQECYALDCPHERGEHDEDCGYVEPVKGHPCGFVCDECGNKELEADNGNNPPAPETDLEQPEEAAVFTITDFDGLDEAVQYQTISPGTKLDMLNLPATLGASGYTVGEDTEPAPIIIGGVTWKPDMEYDDTAEQGGYTFTPVLPAGYTREGDVALPEIYVRIGAANVTLANDIDDYNTDDVAAFQAILDEHTSLVSGDVKKNDPASWTGLVAWDESNPKRITKLYLGNPGLSGTLDVSRLTQLTYLDCSANQLTALDVSGTALTSLYCAGNKLKTLDGLGSLTQLDILSCSANQLTALDVSGTALTQLLCSDNNLESLSGLGSLTQLTSLDCSNNNLETLDGLGSLTNLTFLYCDNNDLTMLDLSGLSYLDNQYSSCENNPFASFKIKDNQTLTVNQTTGGTVWTTDFDFSNSKVTLEARPDTGFSFREWGMSEGNTYTDNPVSFVLDGNMTVEAVFVGDNPDDVNNDGYHDGDVTAFQDILDVHPSLVSGDVKRGDPASWTRLVTWDESNPKRIKELVLDRKNLTGTLDVSSLTALTHLFCSDNDLTALNVSKNTALAYLFCSNNDLTALDLSKNTLLNELVCYDNDLTALDLSKNTLLYYLACSNNPLTSFTPKDGHTLTVNKTTGGTVWTTAFDFSNNKITLEARPDTDFSFQEWTKLPDGITSTTDTVSFTLDGNMTVAANFKGNYTPSTDATLQTLSLSDGITLEPAFNPAIMEYKASVGNNTDTITITATPGDSKAAVEGDGEKKLNEGLNEFTITVTAEDKTSSQNYIVNITREKAAPPSGGGSSSGGDDSSQSYTITTPQPPKPNNPVLAEIELPVTVGNGTATGQLDDARTARAIAEAQKNARAGVNGIALQYRAKTSTAYDGFSITIRRATLERFIDAKVKYVTLDTGIVDLTFDLAALQEIQKQTTGDIILTATRENGLTGDALAAVGTRPTYRLAVGYTGQDGTAAVIQNFGAGRVTVGLAYKPADNEQTGSLFLVYSKDGKEAQWLYQSSYDLGSGNVIGSTGHFSVYGVGYKPAPAFADTVNHWAKADIDFVTSRGLLAGTGETTFTPDGTMTRGMFVVALGRLAGIDPAAYPSSRFSDVAATAYYAPYVEWAASKGIVTRTSETTFAPDATITREQMAVIMQRYANQMGYTLPVAREAELFTDSNKISSGMKEAVQAMQQAGVMNGKGSRLFAPKDTATRAEAAAVLRRFVEIVIDPGAAGGWGQNDAGSWLYYENNKPVTGWKQIEGIWYYFDAAGLMQSRGWRQIGGKWYYFYADGSMAANTEIDGYQIGPDGARNS